MIMYFVVFAITIVYESLVSYVDKVTTSHSGKNIVHHIYSEVCLFKKKKITHTHTHTKDHNSFFLCAVTPLTSIPLN